MIESHLFVSCTLAMAGVNTAIESVERSRNLVLIQFNQVFRLTTSVEADITSTKADVSCVKANVTSAQADVASVETDLTSV